MSVPAPCVLNDGASGAYYVAASLQLSLLRGQTIKAWLQRDLAITRGMI
jgi:hypothetical protein